MIDPATDTVVQHLSLGGLKNCEGLDYLPSTRTVLVACGGSFGSTEQALESGVVVLDASTSPLTLARIISGVAFADAAGQLPLGPGAAVREQPDARVRGDDRQLLPEHPGQAVRRSTSSRAGRRRSGWRRRSISGRPAAGNGRFFVPDANAAMPRIHVYDARAAGAPTLERVVRRRHGERAAAARGRLVLTLADARVGANWSRRAAIGACVGAPLAAAAALSGRVRTALVGARGFTDSWAAPGGFPKTLRGPAGDERILPGPPRRIASTYLARRRAAGGAGPSRPRRRRVGVCRRPRDVELPRRLPGGHRAPARRSGDGHRAGARSGLRGGLHGVRSAAPAGRRRPDGRALVAVRFVRGRHGRDPDAGGGGRRGARARKRWRAASRRCSPTSNAGWRASAGCASSTTIRRPTRWAGARWSMRS